MYYKWIVFAEVKCFVNICSVQDLLCHHAYVLWYFNGSHLHFFNLRLFAMILSLTLFSLV